MHTGAQCDAWYLALFPSKTCSSLSPPCIALILTCPRPTLSRDSYAQEGDYMIPVEFQSDMVQIHAKAGFDKAGR